VNRRNFRRIVFALVAAQWLCAPPVAGALAAVAGGTEAHCSDLMHSQGGNDRRTHDPKGDEDCACCPERELSTAACLSACTASVGALPAFELPVSPAATIPARSDPCVPHALSADPPLDPPPIS
jgi:hypothetical protein